VTLFRKPSSYSRISLDRSGLEEGVTRQDEDTEALRGSHGLPPFVRRFTDNDKSATYGGPRPDYAELIKAVEAKQTDVVLVYMLSRLWRNRAERAAGIEVFQKHRVSVLCVKGPQLDLSTAAGRMLAGVLGEVDTFEVEQMAERESRRMLQKVQQGVPPGGPRCYGYATDGSEIVPDEAEDVRAMFEDLLAGRSLLGIARDLNERGRPNRNGRPWDHGAVRNLLMNERYAALREYPARRKRSDPAGELYPGTWPRIVAEETWRAARYILEDEQRLKSHGETGRKWPLSGLALCGVCNDGETTVTSAQRGYDRRHKEPQVQRCYKCRGKTKHLMRAAEPIDALIELHVIDRLSRADAVDLLVDHQAPQIEDLRTKAVALRARLDALAAEFAEDDQADTREFREASRRIRERLAEVEQQMTHPQRSRVLVDLVLAENPAEVWESMPLDRQRAVVSLLFKITILRGRSGNVPFDPDSVRIEPAEGMG
jgi:site-specific DNA recombinase